MTDKQALLNDLVAAARVPDPIREDEVSVEEFMRRIGTRWQVARDALERLVAEGKATKREARLANGRRGSAYRLLRNGDAAS